MRKRRRGEQRHRVRKRERRVLRAEHRARRNGRAFSDDDRRGAGPAQGRGVPRIGEEREVSLARLLESRDAADLDRSVTFEPASQPLGYFSELHVESRGLLAPGLAANVRIENITRV
jgi:hypothetical protein